MTSPARIPTREALATIAGVLDAVDPDRSALSDGDRLELVALAGVLAGRVEALRCALVAEADAVDASVRAKGTPSSSWLALTGTLSRKESAGLLYRAKDLAASPAVQQEVLAGRIGVDQARSITRVLHDLPATLSGDQRQHAAGVLIGYAQRCDSAQLARMTGQVLAEVAPDLADQADADRLHRQADAARRDRSLWFTRERGSITFRGSLPVADGEGWVAIIDAYVESQRRTALEERDPLAVSLSPQQRRADALVAMIRHHQAGRLAPAGGGDRPRIVVTLHYDTLATRARQVGLLPTGDRIGAGDLRRLCCDADLVPMVLGTASEILDVGRTHRLVTRAIRVALGHRDRGCVFAGCDTHPTACEAHHLVPWWAGGRTDLTNLALLCHHHHGLVEPDKDGHRDQWALRIAADGIPECIPPRRLDPHQAPIRHARFLQGATPLDATGRVRAGARPQRSLPPPRLSLEPPRSEPAHTTTDDPPDRTIPPGGAPADGPPGRVTAAARALAKAVADQPPECEKPPGGARADRPPGRGG